LNFLNLKRTLRFENIRFKKTNTGCRGKGDNTTKKAVDKDSSQKNWVEQMFHPEALSLIEQTED
jgi:hypothetical protein